MRDWSLSMEDIIQAYDSENVTRTIVVGIC